MNVIMKMKNGKAVVSQKPLKQFRRFGASLATARFLRWLDCQHPNAQIPDFILEKQVAILNAYFELPAGGGKTFLAINLIDYERFGKGERS